MQDPLPEPPLPPTFTSRQKFQDRTWLHLTLFLLTALSTTVIGGFHYVSFAQDFLRRPVTLSDAEFFLGGLWYSGTVLIILGTHELGHYLACRYYQVDASLPFFIPMPLLPLTGTLGAFIKIREPIRTKRMLFDIGFAGPLAGFLFAVPALFVGVALSPVVPLPDSLENGLELGEPLLFQAAAYLLWGAIPEGHTLNMHPMLLASWFGLLATAWNLFPVGQLDGGHISYAVFGRRSSSVTLGGIVIAIGLSFLSSAWILWTVLLVIMTAVMGPHHPRTADEDVPLDFPRVCLAVLALVIFFLCFTYNPIEPAELLTD